MKIKVLYVFMNVISDNIVSIMRLYASDFILYRSIHSIQDCEILQNDLLPTTEWSNKWLLDLNVSKCKIMNILNKLLSITLLSPV